MRVNAAASRPRSVDTVFTALGHGGGRDAQDAVRGVNDVQAQRHGDVLADGALPRRGGRASFRRQKTVRAEPAENELASVTVA